MRVFLATCGLALVLAGPAAAAAPGAQGRWVTASGNVEVEIAPCGASLCGNVVRVLANRSMSDPSKTVATPPKVGLQILSGIQPAGEGRWKGRIFNRENGKTYDCLLTPQRDGLTVRSYVILPPFGQTQVWRRAAG